MRQDLCFFRTLLNCSEEFRPKLSLLIYVEIGYSHQFNKDFNDGCFSRQNLGEVGSCYLNKNIVEITGPVNLLRLDDLLDEGLENAYSRDNKVHYLMVFLFIFACKYNKLGYYVCCCFYIIILVRLKFGENHIHEVRIVVNECLKDLFWDGQLNPRIKRAHHFGFHFIFPFCRQLNLIDFLCPLIKNFLEDKSLRRVVQICKEVFTDRFLDIYTFIITIVGHVPEDREEARYLLFSV